MVKVTEADVYYTLSYHVGRSVLEIKKELEHRAGFTRGDKGLAFYFSMLSEPSHGAIRTHLESLIEQGFVRAQERNLTAEQLAWRHGAPQLEYFKTLLGIRNSDKYERKETVGGEGELEPA